MIVRHITNVAGHWKGRCYAWDVVNEALEDDGTWRQSVFYKVLGEDYIKLAFRTAAEVDPDAKLYYNDYNLESVSAKSEAARGIVKMLQADGIRIDGIGMQAHLVAHRAPTLDQQIEVISSYAELGVEVALTELDVRIELPVNETNLEWQKEAYKAVSRGPHVSKVCMTLTRQIVRRSLCPSPRVRRNHHLGLLRPFQLGSLHFRGRGRGPSLV